MRELLTSIANEVKQPAQGSPIIFHINISSGTPQMKESLPFLVSVGQLEPHEVHLWQVFDPRGGAATLAERVQPAPIMDLLTQERILLRLEQLAKQHMYQEANGWLRRGLTVAYLDFAQLVYRVLAAHDQWLYKHAFNSLSGMLSRLTIPGFMQDWINQVSQWLQDLAQDQPPKDKLSIDRYYCACRRLESGLYPDVINHSWTTCELALKKHGEDIGVLGTNEELPASQLIERIYNANNVNSPLNSCPSPIWQNRTLMDDVDWLRRIRNQVEHGTRPVTRELAENAGKIAEQVLQTLRWLPQQHPLQPEVVSKNLPQLIQTMRDSLWR